MPEYEDKEVKCVDCPQTFVWTAGEQQYYAEHDFSPPKRCKPCRQKKRERKDQGGGHR